MNCVTFVKHIPICNFFPLKHLLMDTCTNCSLKILSVNAGSLLYSESLMDFKYFIIIHHIETLSLSEVLPQLCFFLNDFICHKPVFGSNKECFLYPHITQTAVVRVLSFFICKIKSCLN